MQSPDLDVPAGLPSYIDKPMLGRYIAQYATTFGVAADARFGTKVDSVEAADEAWRVRWSERDGATHTETYDAVIVANGHYEEPYAPPIPGDDEWLAADASREIIHSRAYDDASAFRDRSVLVVGGRSSGVDISRMLHGVAKWTYVLEKGCAGAVEHADQAVTCRSARGSAPTESCASTTAPWCRARARRSTASSSPRATCTRFPSWTSRRWAWPSAASAG